MFIEYSCGPSGFSRAGAPRDPKYTHHPDVVTLSHIHCGRVPAWTYDCHQFVMPILCQEKLHLSYGLFSFMAHD